MQFTITLWTLDFITIFYSINCKTAFRNKIQPHTINNSKHNRQLHLGQTYRAFSYKRDYFKALIGGIDQETHNGYITRDLFLAYNQGPKDVSFGWKCYGGWISLAPSVVHLGLRVLIRHHSF